MPESNCLYFMFHHLEICDSGHSIQQGRRLL
ncbi:hypothetical protein VPHK165_0007 [Vibrio phage K165]|nr:hypothetical protein VP115E341_P0005 [Vibrio phage 115E34-1]CAH9011480.1 hypothetical protein VP191E371_P0006 [Vibrio phage 191E37-1]CAH9015934.1 hypothetical protein VP217E381_P0007 [Vibrio phage 217E38-1]